MIEQDEYRIKVLTMLRIEARSVPLRGIVSTSAQVELVRAMKREGWVSTRTMNGVRCVGITREGLRVLKSFERIYR